jgi:hypothetical protein
MTSGFILKLYAIDNGRFKPVLEACSGLNDYCEECDYFNPHINDPMRGKRCRCAGSCPDATLHPELKEYLWRKLDSDAHPVTT